MWKQGNKVKSPDVSRNRRVLFAVVCAVSLPLIIVYLFRNGSDVVVPEFSWSLEEQKWNSFDSLVQMGPTVEFRNGTDIIWQVPDSPKAVLFLAHGCGGRAVNFWDRSFGCPQCYGLPEERLITLHALARKFAVVSISSVGRCWSFGDEVGAVKDLISWWTKEQRLKHLPLVALGASSGGYFVSVLASKVKFSSVAIMIAEGKFDLIDVKENYPPTIFVHMPKDVSRRGMIKKYMGVLRNNGVDVAEIECMEFPLSPHLLSDRIQLLDQSVSVKLFEIFRRKGFLDDNGYMRNDGRRTRWKEAVEEDETFDIGEHLVQPVQEELNLAFAFHEMTSVHTDQIFKWFESHMS